MIRKLLLATAAVAVVTAAPAGRRAAQGVRRRFGDAAGVQSLRAAEHAAVPDARLLARSRTATICPRCSPAWREQKREVTAIANQTGGADLRQHGRRDGALGPAARARQPGLQRGQRRQHQRHAAGDRHQDRAAVRRAQRLHLPQPEAVPALQDAARPPGRARTSTPSRPSCSTSITSSSSMPAPSCRRPSRPQLKAINKRLSTLQTAFGQKLLAAAKAGALHVDDAAALAGLSPEQLAAAQEAAKDRKVARLCPAAAEHDAAAGARFADQPRHAPEAVRREPQPRRAWRRQRHARDRQRDRAAARQEGGAVRRRQLGRLHALRPDGEGPRDGGRLPRPAGAGGRRPRSGRNGPTSSRWPSRRARPSSRPRPTGTSTPSRSASSATRSTATS